METIVKFEEMLFSVEERMLMLVEKPSTRVQACQLLAKSKGLRSEVEEFSLPDLEAEYDEEEGERLDTALEKYNDIRQSLAETQVKYCLNFYTKNYFEGEPSSKNQLKPL